MSDLIWWSAPDGSWGMCHDGGVVIVRDDDLSDDDRDQLEMMVIDGDEKAIHRIIADASERAEVGKP